MSYLLVPSSLISSEAISRVGERDRSPLWYPKQNRKKEKDGASGVSFSEDHHTVVNRKIITIPLCSLLAGHKMSGWYKQILILWPGFWARSAARDPSDPPCGGKGFIFTVYEWMPKLLSLGTVAYGWQLSPPRVWLCIFPNKVDLHWCSVIFLPAHLFFFFLDPRAGPGWLLCVSSTYSGQTLLHLGPFPRQMQKPQWAGELPGQRIVQQKFN